MSSPFSNLKHILVFWQNCKFTIYQPNKAEPDILYKTSSFFKKINLALILRNFDFDIRNLQNRRMHGNLSFRKTRKHN